VRAVILEDAQALPVAHKLPFINSFDVRMVQLGERQGFFTKLFARRVIRDPTSGKYFQGHIAIKSLVTGTVNNPHATGTNLFDDAIVAERLGNEPEMSGHWSRMLDHAEQVGQYKS
jgi:hypothetical protein